jgi:hypothetical protein
MMGLLTRLSLALLARRAVGGKAADEVASLLLLRVVVL